MAKSFLEFDAGSFFRNINKRFVESFRDDILPLLIATIERGSSPVKGQGRYQKYSKRYKDQINKGYYIKYGKRTRPVNLTLSGKMLRSFKVRGLAAGGIVVWMSDKKAKWHNDEGAGRSRVIRKMLPTGSSESFNKEITGAINESLERAISIEIKK